MLNSAHTVMKSAIRRTIKARKCLKKFSTTSRSSLSSLHCMPILKRLKRCAIVALNMSISQAKSMTSLIHIFTNVYLEKRLLLVKRKLHMSTSQALVTLLLASPLMDFHHLSVAKLQLGHLYFSTTISHLRHDFTRTTS